MQRSCQDEEQVLSTTPQPYPQQEARYEEKQEYNDQSKIGGEYPYENPEKEEKESWINTANTPSIQSESLTENTQNCTSLSSSKRMNIARLPAKKRIKQKNYQMEMLALMASTVHEAEVQNSKEPKQKKQNNLLETRASEVVSSTSIKSTDVLFGRGKRSTNHPGNKNYREVISRIAMEYKNSNKQQKTELSNRIVQTIHMQGGRFLTPLSSDWNSWVEVNGLSLRKKTSQALRDVLNQRKNKF